MLSYIVLLFDDYMVPTTSAICVHLVINSFFILLVIISCYLMGFFYYFLLSIFLHSYLHYVSSFSYFSKVLFIFLCNSFIFYNF